MFTSHLNPLKALAVAGFRTSLRHPPLWGLAGMGVLLSSLALVVQVPLTDPVALALDGMAAVDQFLVLLLVQALVLARHGGPLQDSWPVAPEAALFARCLGLTAGLLTLLTAVLAIQVGVIFLAGLVDAATSFTPALRIWAASSALTVALIAWSLLLAIVARPGPAVLAILVLALTGFTLPRLLGRYPSLAPLLGFLPDLGALAPTHLVQQGRLTTLHSAVYPLVHAAAICCLGGLALRMRRGVR